MNFHTLVNSGLSGQAGRKEIIILKLSNLLKMLLYEVLQNFQGVRVVVGGFGGRVVVIVVGSGRPAFNVIGS